MEKYNCLVFDNENAGKKVSLTQRQSKPLQSGQVLIHVLFSSVNYKDALGVSGKGQIFKTNPVIPGIDAAGEILESQSLQFKVGDLVLVTGGGLGETHDGGYSDLLIENAANVVPLPKGLSLRETMIYGTAGFTAALCLERMETNGQRPEMGPIVVTGASGGVGQFAVRFFSQRNYDVIAVSGKPEQHARLIELGAKQVVAPDSLELSDRPLDRVRFGGAIDNVGGKLLSGLIAHVQLWGNVACVGLAASPDLNATVMPMILRGVSLLGISSNNTSWDLRLKIWQRLGSDLKPQNMESFVSQEVGLQKIESASHDILSRKTTGRTLVNLSMKE